VIFEAHGCYSDECGTISLALHFSNGMAFAGYGFGGSILTSRKQKVPFLNFDTLDTATKNVILLIV